MNKDNKVMRKATKDSNSSKYATSVDNYMSIIFAVPINGENIDLENLEYFDIRVKLKILGNKKPTHKENFYSTVYLLGKYSHNKT